MRISSITVWALAAVVVTAGSAPLARAQSSGTAAFGVELARAYQALAAAEQAQGDNRDAETYAARAAAAAAGNPPDPDQLELRQAFLKASYVPELGDARQRLMAAFNKGGRTKAPAAAARAQSSFDCWLEQAAEDLQFADIMACKQSYFAAIAEVEAALIPPPPPPPADSDGDGVLDDADDCPGTPKGTPVDARGCPEIPNLTGVHFEFDKARLTPEAKTHLDGVARTIAKNPAIRVEIIGHTDSMGSDRYNQGLSERRAASARAYLESQGVASSRLSASGEGETSPIADNATASGRAENRRVELTARPR